MFTRPTPIRIIVLILTCGMPSTLWPVLAVEAWDTQPDTWVATDALNRTLPTMAEAGPPRADRTVGAFYFLWLGRHAHKGAPWDVMRILAEDPEAMSKPDSPLWGPNGAMHHWAESIFGYYNTDDPYVLRKHAQMLSDAGVDVVIFDVTNHFTYRPYYQALMQTWSEVRRQGGRTPQVAFLAPFWDPRKVVHELWHDLYEPGLYRELWFLWEGKPLILADPMLVYMQADAVEYQIPADLNPDQTLGQEFAYDKPFAAVAGCFATYHTTDSELTLKLFRAGEEGPALAEQHFRNVLDNGWAILRLPTPLPAGRYRLEASNPVGRIAWYSRNDNPSTEGRALLNRQPVAGARSLHVVTAGDVNERISQFFTFRKPQPDYFCGPTQLDMWSWLEVYPQHVFTNSAGEKEQMSVGVGQNAVNGRLGAMSEPGAQGRSFHNGKLDTRPGAVEHGFNLAEQFEHALKEDPRFIFITGWNEWIAGRYSEFAGVYLPVMFVDQFEQEYSRDIEPMKGGHGDNYYYQMVGYIRRYKGVRPLPPVGEPRTIQINDDFEQWASVTPEYRDDRGDTAHRDFQGYAKHTQYVNTSGRNDIIMAKVARDDRDVFFMVRADQPLTPPEGENWMWLLIDIDSDRRTGWEGYDFLVNRTRPGATTASLERHTDGWGWETVGEVPIRIVGDALHLAIPRKMLGLSATKPFRLDFKWADNVPANGDIVSWLDAGDLAPNGRFNYRFDESCVEDLHNQQP
ncbi:MAG: hypothetical protein GXY44_07020 [Phycisphaerales bacterium]|nr:hypothetical protein [Phycisphaerales bacterium]